MFSSLKKFLNPLEVARFLHSNSFYFTRKDGVFYLNKKGRNEQIKIKRGSVLSQYRQVRDFAYLFDYFALKDITLDDNSLRINNYRDIGIDIARENEDEYMFMSLTFYFDDIRHPYIANPSAELIGYTLKRDIKPKDIVFDCGAFHGWFAIYAAKKAIEGHVYCFEPDESNLKVLEKNIKINKLENVTIVPRVLAGKTGFVDFFEVGAVSSKMPDAPLSPNLQKNVRQVPSVSFRDFCETEKLGMVNFVKMDVEGAEVEIIESSKDFIKDHVESFAIASYHRIGNDPRTTSEMLEPILKDLGFDTETSYPSHKTTYALKRS